MQHTKIVRYIHGRQGKVVASTTTTTTTKTMTPHVYTYTHTTKIPLHNHSSDGKEKGRRTSTAGQKRGMKAGYAR